MSALVHAYVTQCVITIIIKLYFDTIKSDVILWLCVCVCVCVCVFVCLCVCVFACVCV